MSDNRSISIGRDAVGVVATTGDNNKIDAKIDARLSKVTLPPAESVNISAELAQKPFGHLRARGVVRAEEEDAPRGHSSGGRGVSDVNSRITPVTSYTVRSQIFWIRSPIRSRLCATQRSHVARSIVLGSSIMYWSSSR